MNPFDDRDKIIEFKKAKGSSFESLTISKKTAKKFKVTSYPTLYIIDQNGKVAYSKKGGSENIYAELSEEIEKLLK